MPLIEICAQFENKEKFEILRYQTFVFKKMRCSYPSLARTLGSRGKHQLRTHFDLSKKRASGLLVGTTAKGLRIALIFLIIVFSGLTENVSVHLCSFP